MKLLACLQAILVKAAVVEGRTQAFSLQKARLQKEMEVQSKARALKVLRQKLKSEKGNRDLDAAGSRYCDPRGLFKRTYPMGLQTDIVRQQYRKMAIFGHGKKWRNPVVLWPKVYLACFSLANAACAARSALQQSTCNGYE